MKEKKSFFERLTGAKRAEGDMQRQGSPYNYAPSPVSYEGSHSIQPQVSPQEDYAVEPTAQDTSVEQQDENWAGDSEGQLTIDVYQTDNDIVIKSTIAGVKPEDLELSIARDMITIVGVREDVSRDTVDVQDHALGHTAALPLRIENRPEETRPPRLPR